jgi:hypothetical protein
VWSLLSSKIVKRRRIILVSALVTAVVVVAVAFWPDPEPKYGGKRLGEWLSVAFDANYESAQRIEAQAAVRNIGTNALPILLEWIYYAPPDWKISLAERARKYPSLDSKGRLHRWLVEKDLSRFILAEYGFQLLGAAAAPAIPRLREIAADKKVRHRSDLPLVAGMIEAEVRNARLMERQ